MVNSINDLSPDIRDSLLNKNLILSDSISENGLSSLAIGLGLPSTNSTMTSSVLPSEDLEVNGLEIRNDLISRNRYTSIEDMVSATIINNGYGYSQRDGGYISENNELNFGGSGTEGLDIIESITSQNGFGLGNGGIIPQSDIRTTINGRVLGASGAINETPLGIIGGEQLLLALQQRAVFNTQRELFGKVNLQPFSLLSGSDFIVPDNSITIRATTGGRLLDIGLDISGFNLPIDIIDDQASIENGNSIERNNALIRYTGKGQLIRLFDNLNRNKYKPNYESEGSGRGKLGVNDPVEEYEPIIGNDTIFIDKFEEADKIWDPSYSPGNGYDNENTLLTNTKKLFNNDLKHLQILGGKGSGYDLYNSLFNKQGTEVLGDSQLNTPSGGRLSKGSGVLSKDYFLKDGDKENVFSRTWTSTNSYSRVSDLQKNTGLKDYRNRIRNDIKDSVLSENGFVKISPYKVPKSGEDIYDAKKFMFSIENLAWNDDLNSLPKFEIGNGDPITGTKGRIMWFPPYDIKFSDTSTADWDTSKFIGRGEPIYTYNSTERSGNLSFKVIIDYPDYMNDSKITTDELMSSLVAGSLDYDNYFSVNESTLLGQENEANRRESQNVIAPKPTLPKPFSFYFENDISVINPSYEATGLNKQWLEAGFANEISSIMKQNEGIKIKISGYASKAGTVDSNKNLSDERIVSAKNWLIFYLDSEIDKINRISTGISYGDTTSKSTLDTPSDFTSAKKDRVAKIEFIYDADNDKQIKNAVELKKENTNNSKELLEKIKRRFHREDEYFEELKKSGDEGNETDKIIYNNIREKIKFFHPAFHSTTPEGFNSRLTFLQQCTRQGSTKVDSKSFNLAFGSPPVCILRIGDFYNTKIIINNLTINYDPLVWDLNPEGVGVQPMIANVEIAFKFIGGSALSGPINKLQNAISFNYFANTGVYDPRADRFVRKDVIDPKNSVIFDYVEGVDDLRKYIDDETQPDDKPKSILNIPNKQTEVAETASENQVTPITDEELDDRTILEAMTWSVMWLEDAFTLIYNDGVSEPFSDLNDSYTAKLSVIDVITPNENRYLDVLTLTINNETLTGVIESLPIWGEPGYDEYTSEKFQLKITGNGIEPIIKRGF